MYFLLPYIEQDNIYKLGTQAPINTNPQPDAYWGNFADMRTPGANTIKTYVCPSDPTTNPTPTWTNGWVVGSYASNNDVFGDPNSIGWASPSGAAVARMPASFPDGTSMTIGIAEKYARCNGSGTLWAHGEWNPQWEPRFNTWQAAGHPKFQVQPSPSPATTSNCNNVVPQSAHSGGMNVLLCDGSVRFLSASISQPTWASACTPNGGELLGNDW
jgi:prepilin-type processing-associated H-X9-DG protein